MSNGTATNQSQVTAKLPANEAVSTDLATATVFGSEALRRRDNQPLVDVQGMPITEARFISALDKLSQTVNPLTERLAHQHKRVSDQWDSSASHRDTEVLNGIGRDDPISCRRHLIELEEQAIRRIVQLAEGPDAERVIATKTFARHSAEAMQRLQELRTLIHSEFEKHSMVPNANSAIVAMAWAQSHGNFEDAVMTACTHKKALYGRVQLVIWNDIDQNLTFDCIHNMECPGVSYAKTAYEKLGRPQLENTVFPALYGFITDRDGTDGAWGRHLYRKVGAAIFKPQPEPYGVLPGVTDAFEYAKEHGLDMRLLTRNLRLVADGVGEVLGVPHDRIYGRTVQDHASTVKDLVVMRNLLLNPYTVHVVVDDGDSSLINAIKKGSYPDGSGIHQHAFLMARAGADNRAYDLEQTCREMGVPHGLHADNYDPVVNLLHRYVAEKLNDNTVPAANAMKLVPENPRSRTRTDITQP